MREVTESITLPELLKFASQYGGCTHDDLCYVIHQKFELRARKDTP